MATRGHVVVTGAAGYVGSHAVLALRRRGWLVTAVDDLSTGARENTDLAQHFVRLDVRDRSALGALLSNRPTAGVVHLAGVADHTRARRDPEVVVEINAGGTGALLGGMRSAKLRRLVTAVGLPVSGGTPIHRTDELVADLVYRARDAWGLEPAVLRLGHLEGAERSVVDPRPRYRSLVQLQPTERPGTSDRLVDLDLMHVADAGDAVAAALERLMDGDVPGQPLELGLGRFVSAAELDDELARVSDGRGHRPAALPSRAGPMRPADPGDFQRWAPSWTPRYGTLADILRSAWEALGSPSF